MHILFANNYYYLRGGSERVMFEEQTLLIQAGHTVSGFSRKHSENLSCEHSEDFLGMVEFDQLSGLAKIKQAIRLIKNKEAAEKFTLAIEGFKPDVVHAHNIYGGLTTSILDVARRKNIPSVITLHDYKLICPSYLMLNRGQVCEDCRKRRFYHCVLNRCHKNSLLASAVYTAESYYNKWFSKWDSVSYYICPSKFLLNKMAENGLPREKLVYVPNFVDVGKFTPSFEPGDYVLYIGRLSHEKGILTLLKALKGLGIPLRIAGDGPVRKEAEELVSIAKMENIFFEGYKSGEELARLFQNSAFLITPSEWYENAPLTILEAYAYGTPVLGSNLGGIPELVLNDTTGRLFEAGNANVLREQLVWMWNNRSKVLEMGKNARHLVETEFSTQKHMDRLLEIYTSALK